MYQLYTFLQDVSCLGLMAGPHQAVVHQPVGIKPGRPLPVQQFFIGGIAYGHAWRLGHSRQKFNYLPEPVGDSIFAVIGEELGLIGALLLVILFVVFAMRGIKIAKNSPDMFGRLMATGITMWIVFQAFINISANVALVPLTGVPLPFISYGGTSLVFLMAAVGILLNISRQTNMDK